MADCGYHLSLIAAAASPAGVSLMNVLCNHCEGVQQSPQSRESIRNESGELWGVTRLDWLISFVARRASPGLSMKMDMIYDANKLRRRQ